ncbi:uncharacterized protein LOC124289284 [Haliotis rubra]|uniref:uncharacterized protein LOC124289284 n=1 Tax=Haliotis rubra TaxID=36100 RepID=UPI001EE59E35|nr:uncharacterized protein LOC124289284 [Haliotis rubra]
MVLDDLMPLDDLMVFDDLMVLGDLIVLGDLMVLGNLMVLGGLMVLDDLMLLGDLVGDLMVGDLMMLDDLMVLGDLVVLGDLMVLNDLMVLGDLMVLDDLTDAEYLMFVGPPPSKANKFSFGQFYDDFSKLLDDITLKKGNLLLMGDFNIHYESACKPEVKKCVKLLESHGLTQLVFEPTHRNGHTLDWIVARHREDVVQDILVEDRQSSDHFWITVELSFLKPTEGPVEVQCRNLKLVSREDFARDLQSSKLLTEPSEDVNELADLYNTTLIQLMDSHAPCVTRYRRLRHEPQWYNDQILLAKTHRRKSERKWRKTRLEIHRQMYNMARNELNQLIRETKSRYYNDNVFSNQQNPKVLFTHLFSLLGKTSNTTLPNVDDDLTLANDFGKFFSSKIEKIRQEFSPESIAVTGARFQGESFDSFDPLTEEQIICIIKQSKGTTCTLDPAPTKFVLEYFDILLPVFTQIINLSLKCGTVPGCFKQAIVKPLLKKPGLDSTCFSNYRPVSNLPFLSKVLERAVKMQVSQHLSKHDLYHKFQSAYRSFHSTETALLRVVNDLQWSVDRGELSRSCSLGLIGRV